MKRYIVLLLLATQILPAYSSNSLQTDIVPITPDLFPPLNVKVDKLPIVCQTIICNKIIIERTQHDSVVILGVINATVVRILQTIAGICRKNLGCKQKQHYISFHWVFLLIEYCKDDALDNLP